MVLKAKQLPFGQKVSDLVSSAVKSWKFVLIQFAIIVFWIYLNCTNLKFDPYPFEILRLCLIIETAFIANMLFMSQSRSFDKDRKVALSDYYLELQIKNEIRYIRPALDRLETKMELLDKKLNNK